MAQRHYATRKFAKLAALNADIDIGGHVGMAAGKAKRMLNDTWGKRSSTNTKGFFDHKKARAVKRGAV